MIFVNRRRIIQNSGIVKDPTKYWYIEKYVYGVLKETVEIALGSGTTFGSIDSGYSDDTFYGWSVSSTSTTRTFTSTSSYKNTTTNVKNNLDDTNTLKIYAVYSYTTTSWSTSNNEVDTVNEIEIEVSEDGTAVFGGYWVIPANSTTQAAQYGSITLHSSNSYGYYAKIDDTYVTGTVFHSKSNGVGDGTTISKSVLAGQIITMQGKTGSPIYHVNCTVPHWVESTSTKYRVTSH